MKVFKETEQQSAQRQKMKEQIAADIVNDIESLLNQSSESTVKMDESFLKNINLKQYELAPDKSGLTILQKEIFGDRVPNNHTKMKLISTNGMTQVYWLASTSVKSKGS